MFTSSAGSGGPSVSDTESVLFEKASRNLEARNCEEHVMFVEMHLAFSWSLARSLDL